jgi:ABC-type transporter Mla MlaB component
MKRHLTLASRRDDARRHVQTAVSVTPGSNGDSSVADYAEQIGSVDGPDWRHTLILTGRLNDLSAAELQDEIECLREEGVRTLTLDLRQLDGIDSSGFQVIAAQGALFKEGGRRFTVIPGALLSQSFTGEELVRDLPASPSSEAMVPRFSRARAQAALRERSTTMIQYLAPYSQAEAG